MRIYNSLSKKVELFKPLKGKTVRIYSCGPTVYDHIHIGNLASFIFADTLRRTLSASGYQVQHVMNYTDVDDKTISRSKEKFPDDPALEALKKLTDEYIKIFNTDTEAVGNDLKALTFTRATSSIDQIKQLISELHQSGFAYIADDGVYFSIEKYRASGKKYGQLLNLSESSTSEARINNDEYDKDSAHDFALWKKQKDGEPAWDFQLDGVDVTGRPGWHIECSAMSREALGIPFDIHTGGVDLIFPHHENEIAQSTAGKDQDVYAKYFAHNEHLLVDGKKMSKSLDNFYTLEDIKKKGFEPLAFRFLVLQSNYRSQLNFTWESLQAAQNRLDELRQWADLVWQLNKPSDKYSGAIKKIQTAMENDLNTAEALAAFSELVDLGDLSGDITEMRDFLGQIDDLLGLNLLSRSDLGQDEKTILSERELARSSSNWQKADELRDKLLGLGVSVRDTDSGQVWSRTV